MAGREEEEFFILRMPEEAASEVHRSISQKKLKERLKINMANTEKSRQCKVTFDRVEMVGTVTDLPTITEVLKTKDDKVFCKLGDLSQMVVCRPKPKEGDPPLEDIPSQWSHGITPPLKNVRRKRFRKTARKKVKEKAEDEVDRVRREVQRLVNRDKDSRSQSGIEASWKEVWEGGKSAESGDVAQMADLEAFDTPDVAPDISKAGFGDSDDDDDLDDKLSETQSLLSVATSVTVGSMATDGGQRPSGAPSVASVDSLTPLTLGVLTPATTGGPSPILDTGSRTDLNTVVIPAAVNESDEVGSMALDTIATPSVLGGGPMVLETPTGPPPEFRPFEDVSASAAVPMVLETDTTTQPGNAATSGGLDVAVVPTAEGVVAVAEPVDTPEVVTQAQLTTTPAAAPMDVEAVATSTVAVAQPPAAALPTESAAAPAAPVVDEKLLELDRKIEEQRKKVDAQNNPMLKKRFAAQLDKLIKQRAEAGP